MSRSVNHRAWTEPAAAGAAGGSSEPAGVVPETVLVTAIAREIVRARATVRHARAADLDERFDFGADV